MSGRINMLPQWIFTIIWMIHVAKAYNILIIHPTPTYSHQRPVLALTEALVKRGHQLFVANTHRVPGLELNYTYVDVSDYEAVKDKGPDSNNTLDIQKRISKWELVESSNSMALTMSKQFKSEPFLKFLTQVKDKSISFDVSLVESFVAPHMVGMTRFLAGHNTPIIGVATYNGLMYGEDDLGSILHLSFLPSLFSSYTNHMSLWEKIENWFSHHYVSSRMMKILEDKARTYFRETHGPVAESLVDGCWSNFSQSLVFSNFLYRYPRMLGPNIIEVGPVHLKRPEKLPQNLQDWLDGAEKGVIYFSLGSTMKSKSLPGNVRANFLKFFKELPSGYRVLWKWELDGEIPGQSDNILAQKWLPQQSILAHPKVKLFIMQGGLQSFQETVHFGVPVVVIPWFGDQEAQAAKFVKDEIGTRIHPQELHSYEKIESALNAVLFDERYRKNMKRLSAISRDFTAQAMDKAIFWVEHVAKHGHAHHLKPSTIDTMYFQYFCFDILTVIVAFTAIGLYIVCHVSKLLLSAVRSISSSKIKTT